MTISFHYDDIIMGAIASQITSLTIVYSADFSGVDQSKHQSSASLAFVWGIHRGPVNSPHKGPVTRNVFPFDDVIMSTIDAVWYLLLTDNFEAWFSYKIIYHLRIITIGFSGATSSVDFSWGIVHACHWYTFLVILNRIWKGKLMIDHYTIF